MNVGIVIRHPEHARFFREPIVQLRERGHEVTLLVREFRHTTDLLDAYGFDYSVLAGEADGVGELLAGHAAYELGVVREARRTGIDVLSSIGGRAVSHLAPLLGIPSVVFADWDPGTTDRVIARMADVLATPAFLRDEYGGNQVVYDGLHELAYLHPERFQPAPRAGNATDIRIPDGGAGLPDRDDSTAPGRSEAGVTPRDDSEFLTRNHAGISGGSDPGESTVVVGFTSERTETEQITETLAALDELGTVLVAGEHAPNASGFVSDRIPPQSVHDRLAAADLCVTDLGTVATESAVLGTPTVFPGTDPPRRCQHLASHYQLVQFADEESLPSVAVDRLEDDDAATLWRRRQRLLIEESIDVTDFVADRIVAEGA